MIDGLKTVCCGACREEKHLIFHKDGDLYTECTECESVTKLSITKPKIRFDYVGNSYGTLCKID